MLDFSRATATVAAAIGNLAKALSGRGRLGLLALMAAMFSVPAMAGTVTAPTGASIPYPPSLPVDWNGIANANGAATPLDIALVVGRNNALIGVVASAHNVANSGHYGLALPSGACHELPPGYYYQVIVEAGLMQPGADWADSAPFQFSCPRNIDKNTFAARAAGIFSTGPLHPYKGRAVFGTRTQTPQQPKSATAPATAPIGDLRIFKTVVNTTGAPTPTVFGMWAACTGVPYAVPFGVVAGGWNILGSFPAGTKCTISEPSQVPLEPPMNPVPNAPGCAGGGASWSTVISPAQPMTIVAGATIDMTVKNTLSCDSGSLVVFKKVVNTLGAATPASFPMTVNCTSSSGAPNSTSISVSPGQDVTLAILANSACTVHETLVPVAKAPGCNGGSASWNMTTSLAQPVTVGLDAYKVDTITNTLTCDRPPPSGHVTVYKSVVNATGGVAPSMPSFFNVTVHCTPSGPMGAVLPVPANGAVSLAAPVMANSACSLHEQPLADILNLKQCNGASASWTTSYSPGVVIVAGVTSTMTVRNTLTCNKQPTTGSVTIIKKIINDSPIAAPTGPFLVNVNCRPNGPSTTVALTSANNYRQTVSGVPAGSACTVTEQPPQVPADLARMGCRWETSYPDGGGVTAAGGPITTRTVVNHWVCKPGAPAGSPTVFRKLSGAGPPAGEARPTA